MAQMKGQMKDPEKIQLGNEEIPNWSDTEFKTLVIKMLTEMVEYGQGIEGKVKAMKSEIKENVQGTNSDGKETGTQINGLEQKEEISTQPEHNEETRIQKSEERLRNLWDNFKCSNIQVIGMPKGEEEEHKMENSCQQIMKNFPNLAKEMDFREVQET